MGEGEGAARTTQRPGVRRPPLSTPLPPAHSCSAHLSPPPTEPQPQPQRAQILGKLLPALSTSREAAGGLKAGHPGGAGTDTASLRLAGTVAMLKEATAKQPNDHEMWEMLGELLAPTDPPGGWGSRGGAGSWVVGWVGWLGLWLGGWGGWVCGGGSGGWCGPRTHQVVGSVVGWGGWVGGWGVMCG